jgi:predicted Zn-dependent peptidase
MFKKFTLKNGLRVLLVPQKSARAMTAVILVEAGSNYETAEQNGISHFLEHMMFNGTSRRPTPLAIATELDSIGGQSNAFTSYEYTGYWIKAEVGKFDLVLDLISDIFLNPIFDERQIEKERAVISEEMNMYLDTPQRHIWDLWIQLLYGDQPAGRPIIGTRETLARIQREDLIRYVSECYRAESSLVVISGDFEENLIDQVEAAFSGIASGKAPSKPKVEEKQSEPNAILKFKETDQSHIVLGVRGFDMFDPRRYALLTLDAVLGNGMSSRLFQRLREKLGLAYYVGSSADFFMDHGMFTAFAGVDTSRLNLAISAILDEYRRISTEPVPNEEIRKAKDHIRGSLILNLETTDELASFYGPQEIFKKEIITPEEHLKRIEAVTAEDITNAARDIFIENHLNLAVIGPVKDPESLKQLLRLNG